MTSVQESVVVQWPQESLRQGNKARLVHGDSQCLTLKYNQYQIGIEALRAYLDYGILYQG